MERPWEELAPWAWWHDTGLTQRRSDWEGRKHLIHVVELLVYVEARPRMLHVDRPWRTPEIWLVRSDLDGEYMSAVTGNRSSTTAPWFSEDQGRIVWRKPVDIALRDGLIQELTRCGFIPTQPTAEGPVVPHQRRPRERALTPS